MKLAAVKIIMLNYRRKGYSMIDTISSLRLNSLKRQFGIALLVIIAITAFLAFANAHEYCDSAVYAGSGYAGSARISIENENDSGSYTLTMASGYSASNVSFTSGNSTWNLSFHVLHHGQYDGSFSMSCSPWG